MRKGSMVFSGKHDSAMIMRPGSVAIERGGRSVRAAGDSWDSAGISNFGFQKVVGVRLLPAGVVCLPKPASENCGGVKICWQTFRMRTEACLGVTAFPGGYGHDPIRGVAVPRRTCRSVAVFFQTAIQSLAAFVRQSFAAGHVVPTDAGNSVHPGRAGQRGSPLRAHLNHLGSPAVETRCSQTEDLI